MTFVYHSRNPFDLFGTLNFLGVAGPRGGGFNVVKGLEIKATVCGKPVYESQIRPVLWVLKEDADRDVRYFANKTAKKLDLEFGPNL